MTTLLGSEYDYERVLRDSRRYKQVNSDGTFPAWWETYFRDEGLDGCYCRFNGLSALPDAGGSIVGILGMKIPHLNVGHLVAVDEVGVVDPADNAPDHVPLTEYVRSRLLDGVVFDDIWLGVRMLPSSARSAKLAAVILARNGVQGPEQFAAPALPPTGLRVLWATLLRVGRFLAK